MDVLEQGGDPGRRTGLALSPRRVRVVAAIAGLVAVGLVGAELRTTGRAPAPRDPELGGLGAATAAALPPAPAGTFRPGEHVVVSGAGGVVRLELSSGVSTPLRLPTASRVVSGGLISLVAATGVLVEPAAAPADPASGGLYLVPEAGPGRHVTSAGQAVPTPAADGLWVTSGEGASRVLRRIDQAGRTTVAPRALAGDQAIVAETTAGLLVGQRDRLRPGPLDVQTLSGRRTARVAAAGVALDAVVDRLAWARCAEGCPPLLTGLRGAGQLSSRPLGLGRPVVGQLRLSPDGQHVAAVSASALPGDDGPSYDVVVGHLPGTERAGQTATVLSGLPATPPGRPPMIAFTPSGRLLVSTGTQVYVVGAGQPPYRLGVDLPEHDQIATG